MFGGARGARTHQSSLMRAGPLPYGRRAVMVAGAGFEPATTSFKGSSASLQSPRVKLCSFCLFSTFDMLRSTQIDRHHIGICALDMSRFFRERWVCSGLQRGVFGNESHTYLIQKLLRTTVDPNRPPR